MTWYFPLDSVFPFICMYGKKTKRDSNSRKKPGVCGLWVILQGFSLCKSKRILWCPTSFWLGRVIYSIGVARTYRNDSLFPLLSRLPPCASHMVIYILILWIIYLLSFWRTMKERKGKQSTSYKILLSALSNLHTSRAHYWGLSIPLIMTSPIMDKNFS